MPIDFEIQQGLHFIFTNLPNLTQIQIATVGLIANWAVNKLCYSFLTASSVYQPQKGEFYQDFPRKKRL